MTRRPLRTAALAVVALALSGCSLIPVEENTFESAPLPAVSAEATTAVLAEVDAGLDAANAARDPALLAEVADGPLLEIDSARYALDSLTDPDDAVPAAPITRGDPTVFVPRFSDYPQWFVVAAASQPDGPIGIQVLTRDSAAATWFTLIAPELLPDVEFPVLALDDAGYVVPLDAADLGDVPLTAADLLAQQAAALSGTAAPAAPAASPTPGASIATTSPSTERPTAPVTSATMTSATPTTGAPTGATPTATTSAAAGADMTASLAADPWTAARRAADAAAATAVGAAATVTSTYATGAVLEQALRTEDGGALVFYSLTGQRAYAVTPTYFLELDATTAAIVGAAEVTSTLTEDWSAQLAVYLPPAATGTPRVVAARWDRTGLTGS